MKKIAMLFILFICVPVYADDSASMLPPNPFAELYNRANELEEKYLAAKNREQSLANRTLGAVTMAATGIGGMELAQGLAEQRADKDAEMDMTAYMETFRCEYGNGKNVKGGTNGVQLPADKLFDLYQEYITLAADLKERKEALDLKPGIESEVISDKANTGLYDDTSTGITNGTYASVARALTDPNSADAQKWNEQKDATDKNKKIGLGVGIGGAALGGIGNVLTNHIDWDKIKDKKNDSKENKDKIKMFKEGLKSAGMTNVNKLDFDNLDFSEIDVSKIDFSAWKNKLSGKDATQVFNTTNVTSFMSSFPKLSQ
ncbi:MAG: hypothetical protein MJ170_02995 [Alphaproteobacteria bacterium]|nr:hypothetical protein [Alphaproteobacteria bacterium]